MSLSWHRRFRTATLSCAALATAILLASCGGANPGKAPKTGTKVLNYTIGNDLSNMDPSQITDIESAIVASHVYRGLLKTKVDSVDLEPDLAESYEVTTDGLKWTFHLRKNVFFSDGTPLDGEAVLFSVLRQMDANHPYHVPGKMRYAKFLFGDPSSTETALLSEITSPDSHTVIFRLARRYVPFANNLAMTPAAIVSPAAVQSFDRDFNTTMVGTGPFCLASYRPDSSAVLRRNPDYWGTPPPLDEIRFRILRDANVRLNSIRKGQSDVIAGVEPTAIETLKSTPGVVVLSEPAMNLGYISLNNEQPPLDNRLVRVALNHAIDKDYIVNVLFSGTSIVAKGILPPGMLGYVPNRKGFPYDPGKAKQLLAQAGYPNGFTVTFTTHDRPRVYNPVGAKLAERIQQDLSKVGVTVKIDQMEFPSFLDRVKSGQYQMANSGWNTDNGDPDNFIYELAGREDNEVKYSNPPATQLMREAAGETDVARRADMYKRAEEMLADDPPFVYLNHAKQILAVSERVKNFHLHPTAVTHLEQVDVEPK